MILQVLFLVTWDTPLLWDATVSLKCETDSLEEKEQYYGFRIEFKRWGKLKGVLFTVKATLTDIYP